MGFPIREAGRVKSLADSILQRVAGGDPRAVRECIDRYGGLVWSLARRLSPGDAEDGVQDVFVELWNNAGRFDPSRGAEVTFVAMIARRRLIDRRRAAARRGVTAQIPDEAESPAPTPANPVELTDEAAAAARALASLSQEQQRVLRMSIYEGLSHEEIAQATGVPLGTVKTNVRRGLIRVRELLGARSPERAVGVQP